MVLRRIFAAFLLTSSMFAQTSSFPKPSYFREVLAKPQTKVELRAPAKLKDYVVDGKLRLSLKDFLELVMANNTDVQVSFLTLETSRNAITNAFGTWDPSMSLGFTTTRTNSAQFDKDGFIEGSVTKKLDQPFTSSYKQTLPTGTSYTASFGASRSSSTGSYGSPMGGAVNPSMKTDFGLSIDQPLIKNRGTYINRIGVMSAQGKLRSQGYTVRNQIINTVNTAETAYWATVLGREQLKVQVQALETAQVLADYVARQYDLGAIAILDTYNSKKSLESAKANLAKSEFNLRQSEDSLRRQMGADLDPDVRNLPLDLTEPVDLSPSQTITPDREQSVTKAYANHPQLKSIATSLDLDDLSIQQAKNGLLPDLKLSLSYKNSANDGDYWGKSDVPTFLGSGGFGGAFASLLGFHAPVYSAGLTLTLPIRSRSASVTLANALITKKNDTLNQRNQMQTIRLNVLNAITSLEGAKKDLELAEAQKKYADLDYEGMMKKYELGSELQQNVVSSQQSQASANLNVVNAKITLRKSLLGLYNAMGTLLDERGVVVQEPVIPQVSGFFGTRLR